MQEGQLQGAWEGLHSAIAEAQRPLPSRPTLCRLVEEFMLLANMAVAHKVYRAFPEQALLRRHPPPQTKMLSDLVEFCEQMGLPMDFSSAGALNKSLTKTFGGDKYSLARKEVLTNMCSRPMQMAHYFCSGLLQDRAQFRHYALNVPLYTHFTSPIRRFADVLVHRLLAAALGEGCGSSQGEPVPAQSHPPSEWVAWWTEATLL